MTPPFQRMNHPNLGEYPTIAAPTLKPIKNRATSSKDPNLQLQA
jgi:hypothetical protein